MSRIGNIGDFPHNSTTSLQVDHLLLLLFRRGEELFIYENRCPHVRDTLDPLGGSLASPDGLLLHCQRHGAEFLSHNGECVAGPCLGERLTPVAFTLSNGDIYLD
jgi:nitrite reductase/ring-hydroxylating ferredoxin subunit